MYQSLRDLLTPVILPAIKKYSILHTVDVVRRETGVAVLYGKNRCVKLYLPPKAECLLLVLFVSVHGFEPTSAPARNDDPVMATSNPILGIETDLTEEELVEWRGHKGTKSLLETNYCNISVTILRPYDKLFKQIDPRPKKGFPGYKSISKCVAQNTSKKVKAMNLKQHQKFYCESKENEKAWCKCAVSILCTTSICPPVFKCSVLKKG